MASEQVISAGFKPTMDAGQFTSESKRATDGLLGIMAGANKVQLALAGLAAGGLAVATAEAIKLQEQTAELRKLLGDDMARTMTDSILEMAGQIPLARRELFAITEQAARLGVRGEENLNRFTETVATLSMATNATAEQAANSMAKIARVTNTPISKIRNLGAAVNELSNNYGTSAKEIIKATGKLAPTLSQLGIAAPEIMGIAAAMNEVNISVRRGATRLRRVFQQSMNPRNFEEIGSAIGMTAEEFRVAMGSAEGAQEVFQKLIATFAAGGRQADRLRVALASSARQGLGAIAQQGTRVQKAMDDAREAFELGTSHIIEEMRKAQTVGAQWNKNVSQTKSALAELGEETGGILNHIMQFENALDRANDMNWRLIEGEVTQGQARMYKELRRQLLMLQRTGEGFSTVLSEMNRHIEVLGPQARQAFVKNMMPAIRDTSIEAETLIRLGAKYARVLRNIPQDSMDMITEDLIAGDDVIPDWLGAEGFTGGGGPGPTEELINNLRETRREMRGGRMAAIRLSEGWKTATDAQRTMIRGLVRMNNLFDSLRFQEGFPLKSIQRMKDMLSEAKSTAGVTQNAISGLRVMINRMAQEGKSAEEILQILRHALEDMDVDLSELNNTMQDSIDKLPKWQQEIVEAEDAFSELSKTIVDRRLDTLPALQDQLTGENIFEQNIVSDEWIERKREEISGAEDEIKEAIDNMNDQIKEMRFQTIESKMRLLEDVAREMTDAFFDMFDSLVKGTEDTEEAIADFISSISKQIASSILQSLLMDALTSGMNANSGGSGGSSSLLPGFQHGGMVGAGNPVIVGESGRELFVPDTSGRVVPNKDLGGGGSGNNVNVSVSIQAIDSQSVKDMLEKNRNVITDQVVKGVNQSQARRRQMTR